MPDLIFLSGAPGSGKTTIGKLLQKRLNSVFIEVGRIRELHLNKTWNNATKKEEQMSFENLVFILKNYIKNGYKNIIITDLKDERIQEIPKVFSRLNYKIISLIVKEDQELKKRVKGNRDSGFKNSKEAVLRNKKLRNREAVSNEIKIDNTDLSPNKVVEEILELL
tara:strand:+ start:1159 stop:1656 length:498 start_codon:yes stop_codon:yes gene_type:complete